ncbi:MAG: cellulose synthase subunit BcsC-related outer membrane protein, partial [Pseudomonas sp.]|nr:cellulose synthase subunit BcsC-related outer membrane protein [Pseudomonas sp.]
TLYQQQNPTITLYHDYGWRTDNSASGLSDLVTQTSILRVDAPLAEGQGFLQAENIDLNADSFATNADGRTTTSFGTCSVQLRNSSTGALLPKGCVNESQNVSGNTLALGWRNSQWAFDLGRTPDTFEIPNWLGGVSYSSDWKTLGWTLTASRRPVSNSVVSYSGAVDPNTGIRWGGVTSNGLTLSLSHDQGGVDGVWASLGTYWLRGKNVEDNQKRSAMTGYYYRLIDRADERMRTGLTLMYWGYDNNQDEYTLGNGGYYSPQQYYSVSVPLTYSWRNSDWSVHLESSVGWSHSNIDGSSGSKLQSLVTNAGYDVIDGSRLASSSSSSSGGSIRLQGLFERRLSDHMVLGSGITWQHSDAYAPSAVVFYLRYSFDIWRGNLPLPIEPVTPYANMR